MFPIRVFHLTYIRLGPLGSVYSRVQTQFKAVAEQQKKKEKTTPPWVFGETYTTIGLRCKPTAFRRARRTEKRVKRHLNKKKKPIEIAIDWTQMCSDVDVDSVLHPKLHSTGFARVYLAASSRSFPFFGGLSIDSVRCYWKSFPSKQRNERDPRHRRGSRVSQNPDVLFKRPKEGR